jgi:hypothetical protein
MLKKIMIICPLLFIYFIANAQDIYKHHIVIEPGVYHMLDFPVNIRSQPNLQGIIIGRLNLYDEIEVIEDAGNEQQIENVWACWYKIKHGNIIGFIWGGYIARGSSVPGENYFSFWRYSDIQNINGTNYGIIDSRKDIIIYLDGKKSSTQGLIFEGNYIYFYCEFTFWGPGVRAINLYYQIIPNKRYVNFRHFIRGRGNEIWGELVIDQYSPYDEDGRSLYRQ